MSRKLDNTAYINKIAVRTVDDLDSLDQDEIIEGYNDGRKNEPEPGHNRSRSYWHGWRNGMVDGGHREIDDAQRELARSVVQSWKR